MTRHRARRRAVGMVLVLGMTGAPCFAGTPNEAAAEAAFAAGRALMRQGRYEEACKKLETSLALDPALGTLLNLAECLERSGRNASAWVRYREAAGMALRSNQREREAIAREKAAELEPSLCHLVIRAPRAGIVVRRDGVPLEPDVVDLPVPVDPGPHVVEALSGDDPVARREVLVRAPEGGQACPDVVVSLEVSQRPAAARPAPSVPTTESKAAAPRYDRGWFSLGRAVGLGLGGVGVAGLGIGTAFALSAASTNGDADKFCTAAGCLPEGKALRADAGQSADIATVAFIAGTALLAGGVVLWFVSAPSASSGSRSAVSRALLVF